MAVVILGLLVLITAAQVLESMQLPSTHPMHEIVDRINEKAGPYIGVIMAFSTEEISLEVSGDFVPSSDFPSVDLAGRRFNIGKIRGVDVIYAMTGEKTVNAALTTQLLVDTFEIRGIVHYGIAGCCNESMSIGDVGVLNYVAFTSSWEWMKYNSSETEESPDTLSFGAFNVPEKGQNLLAEIEFTTEELYANGKSVEEMFWLPIEPKWFNLAATKLENLTLKQCVNETYCLPQTPKVIPGVRGSTADIFLSNAAYGKFLFNEFNISTVDEESAAVVMTALSNGVPSIVFRGISDKTKTEENLKISSTSLESFAADNAVYVAIEFIGLIKDAAFHDM